MGHFDLGPRMSHPVSKLRIRCKDCFTILHNERGQKRHGNYINGFSERKLIVFWAIWSFWNKNGALFTLNLLSGFFIYFTQKEGLRGTWKFFYSLRKNLFWGNLTSSSHFLMFDWVWSKLSRATVTTGSLKSQDMIKILKWSGHDFSDKRLCNR